MPAWEAILIAVAAFEAGVIFGAWWGGREAEVDWTEQKILEEEQQQKKLNEETIARLLGGHH